MFVGDVWSCHKNPIFENAYYALAEELRDDLKLVTVDMIGYDEPAKYYVINFTTRSEWDKDEPIWCYFFISFYQGQIISQHQGKEFCNHRATAEASIDKVRKIKSDKNLKYHIFTSRKILMCLEIIDISQIIF